MDRFERGALSFDVRESGPPDGEGVICLHGFPQDAGAYDGVVARLAAHGLRVLTPLQRGYSPRARPRRRASYAMPELVADVVALLDAAELDRAHIVGHDVGGVVAWAMAGRHADRVRSVTVLSTPHPAAFSAAAVRSTQALRSSYIAVLQLPWLPERVALTGQPPVLQRALVAGGLPPDIAARYAARMGESGALSAALAWYRALPLSRGYAAGRIRVPTGFVWGGRDPVFTRQAYAFTAKFVTGPYVERGLPEAGHWLPETEPEEVARMVLEVVSRSS